MRDVGRDEFADVEADRAWPKVGVGERKNDRGVVDGCCRRLGDIGLLSAREDGRIPKALLGPRDGGLLASGLATPISAARFDGVALSRKRDDVVDRRRSATRGDGIPGRLGNGLFALLPLVPLFALLPEAAETDRKMGSSGLSGSAGGKPTVLALGVSSPSLTITHPLGLRKVAPDLSGSIGVDCFRAGGAGRAEGVRSSAFGFTVDTVLRLIPRGRPPDTRRLGALAPSLSSVAFKRACKSCSSRNPLVFAARFGLVGCPLGGRAGDETMLFRLRTSEGEAALCARLRDVVDRARVDKPLGESTSLVEYRLTAGDSVGIEDDVLLRTSTEVRRGGSGVVAWGRTFGSSR